MRVRFAVCMVGLIVCAGPSPCQEPKPLTPEQVEKDRPDGTVTVRFRVDDVGLMWGLVPVGQPPYIPISLRAAANLKDRRSQFSAVFFGKALTIVHRLGIDAREHFPGTTVEVTGKVTYMTVPQTSRPGGTAEVPADSYTHYQILIDNLDNFRTLTSPFRSRGSQ
jgi:hypothetical protein